MVKTAFQDKDYKLLYSIIIVNWNTKDYLEKCLKSLETYHNPADGEIIVIDNNSTDGSCKLVEIHFPSVILIKCKENLGFSKANNLGILQSKGRYLFLINSDIEILGDCFSELIYNLESDPLIGILGPKILNSDMTLQRSWTVFPSLWRIILRTMALDTLWEHLFRKDADQNTPTLTSCNEVEVLFGSFWVVRKTSLEEVGLLDEDYFMYAEDLDWCYRFKKYGWKICYCPQTEVIHYGGISSSKNPLKYALIKRDSDTLFIQKHSAILYLFFVLMNILGDLFRFMCFSTLYMFKRSEHLKYKVFRSRKLLSNSTYRLIRCQQ